MNNEFTFREASLSDLASLQKLILQLGYKIEDGVLSQNISLYLEDPLKGVFVSVRKGEVFGFLAYSILPVFHSGKNEMRIVSIVVDEASRGAGIGKALMDRAEEIARERGCVAIELTSGDHREKAHAFYQLLGYSSSSQKLYFRKG